MIDEIAIAILAYITFMMYGGPINQQQQEQLIQVIFDEPIIEYRENNQKGVES